MIIAPPIQRVAGILSQPVRDNPQNRQRPVRPRPKSPSRAPVCSRRHTAANLRSGDGAIPTLRNARVYRGDNFQFGCQVPVPGKTPQKPKKPKVNCISDLLGSFDGYVFATPEYNHGVPGALKNAVDFLFREWNRKSTAFLSVLNRATASVRWRVPRLDCLPVFES